MIQSALHVAINVTDLTAAEDFYGRLLGLPKVDRVLKFPGAWYQVGEFQIHLIVRESGGSAPKTPAKWGRYPHVALAVHDLEALQHSLTQAGVPIQPSASGRAALFAQDPDGNVIELSQH
jgi:glyoxylase I family protein